MLHRDQHGTMSTTTALRILAFGDSLTIGVSTPGEPRVPYALSLERELRECCASAQDSDDAVVVDACGFAGISSDSVLRGLEQHQGILSILHAASEAGAPYHCVVLLLGTNDFLRNDDDRLISNLCAMHAAIHKCGVQSIALGVPQSRISEQCTERSERLQRLNQTIATQSGASLFVDTASILPYDAASDLWSSDGVHLSRKGYEKLGRALTAPIVGLISAAI